jgi:hypothetical protein
VTTTPESPKTRTTQYAATSRRLVSQAGKIVLDANDEIGKGTFDFANWAKSANQLVDLALSAGLQLAPSMMPIPCFSESCFSQSTEDFGLSDFIEAAPDGECERVLSVAQSFVQDGAPSSVIPDQFVVFVPAILPVNGTKFRVRVIWPDLRCGTYRGRIRLTRIKTATVSDTEMDVSIDL